MSITIIDGTKPPSPLYVREPKPDFRMLKHPELEAQKYYETWFRRWIEGYGELTGPHVFYMQEIMLKDIMGNIFYPEWRDLDSLVFGQIKECMDASEDGLWYKARDKGITSIFGGGMPMWFARIFPGITISLTGKDTKNIRKMFEDKIMVAYQNIDPMIMNPTPLNINRTKNSVYLKLGLKKRMDDGSVKTLETEFNIVESSETDDSATAFSGTRSPYMYIDEAPLHKRIAKVIRSSEAVRMRGDKKMGFLAMGGTVEDTLNRQQLAEFQQLINDSKSKGIRTFFIPAWMGLPSYMNNGWSDEKAGTEWVLQMLEKKQQSSDPNDALAWRKNYPLSEQDIFDLATGTGVFEPDVINLLNDTLNKLSKEGSSESAYNILIRGGEYVAEPDSRRRTKDDGGFWVTEMPEQGQQYYQTIDGAASGKEDGAEEGSWIASVIWKATSLNGDHYCPVCIYWERPNRLEDGYRNMVNQFMFYNKHNGMIHINYETNAGVGGNFGTYLDNNGLFKYIMKRKDLTSKGYINTKKLGTAVDPHILKNLINRGNIFLRRHAHKFKSKMVLTQLLAPESENADIRSSFLIFMASIADWDKVKKEQPKMEYKSIIRLVTKPDGSTVYETKKIPISNASLSSDDTSAVLVMQNELRRKYGEHWFQRSTPEEKESYLLLKGQGL